MGQKKKGKTRGDKTSVDRASNASDLSMFSTASSAAISEISDSCITASEDGTFQLKGFLHTERVKSFLDHEWPWNDPTKASCIPEELAMAGFYWDYREDKSLTVRCYACNVAVDSEKIDAGTNMWIYHQELNPNCPHLLLGKRKLASEYKFHEIFNIYIDKIQENKAKLYLEQEKKTLETLNSILASQK